MEEQELENLCREAIASYPDKVKEYREGKITLLGLFVGEAMKRSKGLADPRLTTNLITRLLA